MSEFSFRSRGRAISRFKTETFDFLIVGGGITGAGVARDASRRGLKVALIEQGDFASGTSSASSKLIHGGLRYLETFEFGLVFESLSERAHLLRDIPHLVHPLKFYFPIYDTDRNGRFKMGLGMWLYDTLSLFRAPGFHKSFSARALAKEIPFMRSKGLKGGFSYFDASMRDDVMTMEVMRSAAESGAAVANYVQAISPIWTGERITGFNARDMESGENFTIRATRTISCAGPWTDHFGHRLDAGKWRNWLTPSKGIHLVFSQKRLPVPGAVVMSQPDDGRISFVIPRPDMGMNEGEGIVIVGTTDSPSPDDPARARVERDDVNYLLNLLNSYFPDLKLSTSDILSGYVGVRPLVGAHASEGQSAKLQKVSREHRIDQGPGGVTLVAGGKYTTYRVMAEQVVETALQHWKMDSASPPPPQLKHANTRDPIAPQPPSDGSIEGRLRHAVNNELAMHLTDFYFRRTPLFLSRKDHGLPEAEALSKVWAKERALGEPERLAELEALKRAIADRSFAF